MGCLLTGENFGKYDMLLLRCDDELVVTSSGTRGYFDTAYADVLVYPSHDAQHLPKLQVHDGAI